METRAHHILIGLFTVLVAAAAVLFALWLGKVDRDRKFNLYDVVFEESVTGLSRGGAVQFNGIRIGEVQSLRLDPQDPRRVLARISVDSQAPIRKDTHARLILTGVTGISVIRLTSGDNLDSPPLVPTAKQPVPVIVADPSPFNKLLADSGDIIVNVNETLIQVRKIFSDENVDNLHRTLRNLEQSTHAVAAQREEIAHALQELARASAQANAAMTTAAQVANNTNQLLNEQGKQTLESARQSMAALERSMATVDKLLNDNRGQLDSGMRGLADLGPAITELRATLASLRQITRRLEDRPADFLLGRERTREFKP